jgi:uncharacterized coiled-coil protein SlyX
MTSYWVEFQGNGEPWRARIVDGEFQWSSRRTDGTWAAVALPSRYVVDQFMSQVIMKQATWSCGQPNSTKTDGTPILELVIEDMKARSDLGERKYGTVLQAGNGRDALQDAYEEALDLAMYLRQELANRRIKPSPAPSGTATTSPEVQGKECCRMVVDIVEGSEQRLDDRIGDCAARAAVRAENLEVRVDRLENRAHDANTHIANLASRITEVAQMSGRLDAHLDNLKRLNAAKNDQNDRLAANAERMSAAERNIKALAERMNAMEDDRHGRLDKLEKKVAAQGGAIREASWLYQAVNITLDELDRTIERLVRHPVHSTGLVRRENSAVLRDLLACSTECRSIYSDIVDFNTSPHTVGEALAYWRGIRDRLTKFATDTCTRLGIPAAPP